MKILIFCFLLTGCHCFWECPLDGKCASWCERSDRAEDLCKKHGGVKDLNFAKSVCTDGTIVINDSL
jgi:hypothetical protein